jgi:opacity protein-like surface antigen
MKKIILLTLLCSFCEYLNANDNQSKSSEATPSSGVPLSATSSGAIYGGVNSNYTYGNNYVPISVKGGLPDNNQTIYGQRTETKHMSQSTFGWGGFIGYAYSLNKIIFMTDISYDYNKMKQRITGEEVYTYFPSADIYAPLLEHDINGTYNLVFKRDSTWSFSSRLGYALSPRVILFAKAALLSSKFHLEFETKTKPLKSNKKNLIGIEPGAGFDINFSDDIFFRAEYGYQIFKKFTTSNLNSAPEAPEDAVICNVSPRYHVMRFGLEYKFKTF